MQDFEAMGRSAPPDGLSGVFVGYAMALNPTEFKRCLGRAALVLAPSGEAALAVGLPAAPSADHQLRWLLQLLPARIANTKLPVLDVQRRVRVLAAAEHLQSLLG
jgi:hypothetical protein